MSNQSQSVVENQYGEVSIGTTLPIGGASGPIYIMPTGTKVFSGTGVPSQTAPEGSIYLRSDGNSLNLLLYVNTDGAATWAAASLTGGAAGLSTPLTGFVSGSGTVSASDTILSGFDKVVGNQSLLQNGTFTPTSETVSVAGAISVSTMLSVLSNGTAGTFAATLAAPSSQDGQLKLLKMTTATHTVTIAMTNISMSGAYTPTGTTTLTFSATGQTAVLMALGSKWVYLGGSAVAS